MRDPRREDVVFNGTGGGRDQVPDSALPMRMDDKHFDFYEPRLDVEGFVADYFTYRAEQEGFEWFDAPELPFGVQPEHHTMRYLASLFEKRHAQELENLIKELLEDEVLTFNRFCEIVEVMGRNSNDEPSSMNYGRLVGIISFGGLAAARLLTINLRKQVSQIFLYASRFIRGRINQTWEQDGYTWEDFMQLGLKIKKREEANEAAEARRRSSRRWSIIGMGAAVAVVGAALIGSRLLAK